MANSYVESALFNNLDLKQSVRAATVSNINLSGSQQIDGVSLSAGNRVLVKNQNSPAQNGIYVVKSGVWSRSQDANNSSKVTPGLLVFVEEGSINSSSNWQLTTTSPITLGSTNLVFSKTGDIANGAVTDAKIANMAASKLTGTLDDERLSSNVTRNENLRWAMQTTTTSIDWLPRGHGVLGNAFATSGGLILNFFTAPYSFTATTLTFCTGGTATAGLSLCRFGLFTVSETITDGVTLPTPVVTLVARTGNDTTIGNVQNTIYSRTFASDGLPNSYNLVAGTRYAAGLLVIGTTPGTWQCGTVTTGVLMRLPPMVAGFVGLLNDLPTAPTSVSSGTFVLYGRVS